MTTIHTAMAMFLTQKDNTPSHAKGPVERQRGERGGRQRRRDEQVENRHPRSEDRLVLPVPEDRESEQKALRDQVRHQNREGEPCEIVQQLGQLGCAIRAEGAEEPEHVGDQEECGRTAGTGDQAVGQDRRPECHPANLHRQQDHDRDQTHAEPVEQDHAVADPRGLVAIEARDLLADMFGDIGCTKPGNRKNAEIQMIATTGNVQKRINSPSGCLIV